MRLTYGLVSSSVLMLSLVGGGCSNLADDCANTSSCPPSGGASSAGSSGASGKSGNSGGGSDAGGESGSSTGGSSSGTAGSSGNSGDAGSGGGGGGDCDVTASPAAEACLVSDDYAVFVAPDGSDDAAGTQAAPFASLTKAVETAGDKLVLVCSGSYDEHVSVTAGARVFGGFACDDWSSAADKPLFKPTTTGPALSIDTVIDEVLIENVAFEVADASGAGATALAAVVNASPNVTLRSVSLVAGEGQAGADGSLTNFAFPSADTLNGNPESPATMGGAEKICACQPGLMSVGGLGGAPSSSGQAGAKGLPDHGAGGAGTPASCGSGGTGQDGNDAAARPASAGAAMLGSASASGWTPAAGTDGATGQPGQGGGGGASRNSSGHGGGGGCGGCGGNGGTAGKGGGGSIALLAIDSPVVLEASTLTTADAGDGGGGAAGQPGQQDVGSGGNAVASANSCGGGTGGKGGAGGAGGGGAGGISVGVVWSGEVAPTLSADTTITNGEAGAKGTGGSAGNNDGVAGVSQKVLELN